jgi:hypothetical protein
MRGKRELKALKSCEERKIKRKSMSVEKKERKKERKKKITCE